MPKIMSSVTFTRQQRLVIVAGNKLKSVIFQLRVYECTI